MFFPAVNLCDRASGLFSRSKIWCESYSDTCFIFVLICSPVFRNKRRLDLLHPPRSLWLEKNVSSVLSTSSFFFAVFSSREVKGSNVLCGLMDRSGFPVKYTSVMTFFFFSSKWLVLAEVEPYIVMIAVSHWWVRCTLVEKIVLYQSFSFFHNLKTFFCSLTNSYVVHATLCYVYVNLTNLDKTKDTWALGDML